MRVTTLVIDDPNSKDLVTSVHHDEHSAVESLIDRYQHEFGETTDYASDPVQFLCDRGYVIKIDEHLYADDSWCLTVYGEADVWAEKILPSLLHHTVRLTVEGVDQDVFVTSIDGLKIFGQRHDEEAGEPVGEILSFNVDPSLDQVHVY